MAKTNTIESFFNYLDFYSNFLPILFFLVYFKKSRGKRVLWFIVIYALYNYLTALGTITFYSTTMQAFLYAYFTLLEYLLFTFVFYILINNKRFKKLIILLSICFIAFFIPYNIFGTIRGIDSTPIGIETILILIFSFYYFYEQMQDIENSIFIYNKYSFWLIIGMMLYLSGCFFIYIYTSYLPDDKTILKYWIFTNVFSMLKNIFFTIAIIIHAYQSHKKQTLKNSMPVLNLQNL